MTADGSTPGTRWLDKVLCGDALDCLKQLPDRLVDTIITSPPYYRQRDYGDARQIGQEASSEAYVTALLKVFEECQRVLKSTGCCWLVLGDKYLSGQLQGLPWRIVLGMQQQGWLLRSDIIWHKPNAMPSAVKNRPTRDHDYVFLLSRERNYYYDADAIREPHVTFSAESRMRGGRGHFFRRGSTPETGKNGGDINLHNGRWDQAFHPQGRNKRTVWNVPLSKSRDLHFAVFPEPLVETMIAAGTPPGGLVLDPFLGSGTTAVVAQRLGRRYLGIDCVEEYCQIARQRLASRSVSPE